MRIIFLTKNEESSYKMYSKVITDVENWKENIKKLFEIPNVKICELLIIDDNELKWLDLNKFTGRNFQNYLVTLDKKLFKISDYFGKENQRSNEPFFMRALPLRYIMLKNPLFNFSTQSIYVEKIMKDQFETDEPNIYGVKFPVTDSISARDFIKGFLKYHKIYESDIEGLHDFETDNGLEGLADFIEEEDSGLDSGLDSELIYGMLLNSLSILGIKENNDAKDYFNDVIEEIRCEMKVEYDEEYTGSGSDIYDFGPWNR